MKSTATEYESNPKGQRYLGEKGLVVLITFLSAFIPLTTDLYLPALPQMAENFNSTASLVNLTLIFFFIFFAGATLLWGPLSDKYGRKRILMIGLVLYTISSALCALSGNVYQLIIFRVFQAIASGAVTAVGSAVVKDVYSGRKRESVLALVSSMVMIAPIVAPVIGAAILSFTSWRGVFWALTAVGFLTTVGGLAMEETIDKYYKGNIFQSLGRLKVVAKNPGFSALLITFSLSAIPMMAFISASSYIYINYFGLSEQVYSYFFAGNALFLVAGPLIYMKLSKHSNINKIIIVSFISLSLSGLLISIFGSMGPLFFALSLIPATLMGSVMRPPSAHLMLEQQQEDTGSASSLMGCTFTLLGSIGMVLISADWTNRIVVMGLLYLVIGVLSLVLWLYFSKKTYVRPVPNLHNNEVQV